MNFSLYSMIIDIFIVFIFLTMLVFGYLKGFVYRAYDLVVTILSLLIALFASSPLANIISIYEVAGIGEIIGNIVNRVIIFIILFIVIKIIGFLMGMLVKPLLKNIIYTISLFEHFDRFLGAIVSMIESVIIIYMPLIFFVIPVLPNGKDGVENSVFASKVINLVPNVTDEMEGLTDGLNAINNLVNEGINYDGYNATNIVAIANSLNMAYEHNLISQDKLESIVIKYYDDIDQIDAKITLNQEQYQAVKTLLHKVDTTKINQSKILEKIIVSE